MAAFVKKLFKWSKEKTIKFLKWIWQECKDWHTVVLLLAVIVVVYSPVWMGYILFWVFDLKWAGIVATAIMAFWAGPFSPFFALCISITLGIKRWFEKKGKFNRTSGADSSDENVDSKTNEQK